MGVVFEAVDQQLGRTVAVKLLRLDREIAPGAVERLDREAKAAARLGHPNIVQVLDFGRSEGEAFLVMEQLTGATLADRIWDERMLRVTSASRIHLQLLDALGAAHSQGVLHRDVKPANVFVTRLADGSELVKLLDFGLAYLLEEPASPKLTKTGFVVGTPAYMAPERVRGADVDTRADIYAVGVSLFESLTGRLPFVADNPMALRGKILMDGSPSARALRPEITQELDAVVTRALAKRPEDRFQSAQAMAEALRAASSISARRSAASSDDDALGPTLCPSREITARGPAHDDASLAPTMAASDEITAAAPAAVPVTRASVPHDPFATGDTMLAANLAPAPAPAHRGMAGWLTGLALGAGLGILLLAGAAVWKIVQRPSSAPRPEAEHDAVAPPTPTEPARAQEIPVEPTLAPVVEELPAAEPEPTTPPTVLEELPPSKLRRGPRVHRPPAVVPPPEPLPLPPEPAPSRPEVDRPLEPDWSRRFGR